MRKILLIILLLNVVHGYAQQFGANAPSTQWKETGTDTANVIFPKGLDSLASRVAALAAHQQKNFSHTIGEKIKPINIVLQNEVNNSNGYVGWMPYRSEFFLTPPTNAFEMGALKWEDMLTLHEFRHVQQYSNFNNGATKVMSFLFGEGGRALANALAVPNWFFEGDAVYTETLLSTQGRGKIPLFHNGYKALHVSDKKYSYMKLRNGSFKHYVPNHYQLGYLFTAFGYEKYGDEFWKHVTQRATAFRPLIYPMQKNIEKYSGLRFRKFVDSSFDYYAKQWDNDASNEVRFMSNVQKNNVIDYTYLYPKNEDGLIVLKKSYRQIPAFYQLKNGKEEKIATKYIGKDDYFSYNNGKIIYAVHTPDKRWRYHEYSDIQLLDIKTNTQKKITNKKRYYTPDISPSGELIAAAEILPDQKPSLIVLNKKGEVKHNYPAHGRNIYTYPKFVDDGKLVMIERNENGEMSLQEMNVATGEKKILLPFKNVLIGYPVVKQDTIFYTRSAAQYDEAMAYVLSTNKNYKLATYSTGVYHSFLQNNVLIGSVFTADGYRLAAFTPQWQEWNAATDSLKLLYNKVPANAAFETLKQFDEKQIPSQHYAKSRGLLNFHSMQPYFSDPDYTLSFLSENILNTFVADVSYTFNRTERFHRGAIGLQYGGWYLQPFLNMSATYKREMRVFSSADSAFHRLAWNELNTGLGFQLPLNFTSRKMYRSFLYTSSVHNNNVYYTASPNDAPDKNIIYFNNRIWYSQQSQRALQQIHPQWAQNFSATFRNGINKFKSYQFSTSANLYFPGLFATHSLVVNGAFQKSDTLNNYIFSSIFPFSRGYNAINFKEMYKAGANYHFPILYPDFGFANIVYFKRIRANLFYDHTVAFNRLNRRYIYTSTGAELYFDTNWWNQMPASFGIRYSRLLNGEYTSAARNRWEIILPVNLYGN